MAADPHGVVVTGGAGYIGSHACKALSRAGYRAVVFDNLVAGHRAAVQYGAALREHELSAVMNFAAFLDVGESVREPARYYRNNVAGALGVLEAMATESVNTSSSRPRAPPTASRSRRRSLKGIRSGRLGRMARRSWPWNGRCRDDYPTPDGTCLRDYIHVSDLADAHVKALGRISGTTGTHASGAYNLGTGHPHSVREVIVECVTGRTVAWTMARRRHGDPAVLFAAADKARRARSCTGRLGFRTSSRSFVPRGNGIGRIPAATIRRPLRKGQWTGSLGSQIDGPESGTPISGFWHNSKNPSPTAHARALMISHTPSRWG